MFQSTLQWDERLYHRDQLRAGRYAALADAEGFLAICFALEALGLRLLGKKADLGKYEPKLRELSQGSVVLSALTEEHPCRFSKFDPLFDLVRKARNDAMHTGVYARHATTAAIELCIGMEEALMKTQQQSRQTVRDLMVKAPVTVDNWQPIAHVRQLMLTHSFSFLPVFHDGWKLISEAALARYMRSGKDWKTLLSAPINHASGHGLVLIDAKVVKLKDEIHTLLTENSELGATWLWLVEDDNKNLCGILSPFELM